MAGMVWGPHIFLSAKGEKLQPPFWNVIIKPKALDVYHMISVCVYVLYIGLDVDVEPLMFVIVRWLAHEVNSDGPL